MTWVKLDDSFESHRKIEAVGLEAAGLYTRALAYCGRYLTDGHVDESWLKRVVPHGAKRSRLVDDLVMVGLFEPNGNGFAVHDYLDYNPSRAEVEGRRNAASERKRKERSLRDS